MDAEMTKEIIKRYLGTSLTEQHFYDDATVDELRREFAIPLVQHTQVQMLLEVGANHSARMSEQAAIDLKPIRLELDRLNKAICKLTHEFESVSEETWFLMREAGFLRSSSETPFPKVIEPDGGDAVTALRTLQFVDQVSGKVEEVTLSSLFHMISALAECSVSTKPFAGAGRAGRPNDDAMFDLLFNAWGIWVAVLQRDFTLDWAPNGEPVTPAARFCTCISNIVDPGVTQQRIRTAARKVHEFDLNVSDLEELTQEIDNFHKRLE